MSTRDIQSHIDEIYGHNLSPETISSITDTVIERAKEWQSRPLQQVYPIVFGNNNGFPMLKFRNALCTKYVIL